MFQLTALCRDIYQDNMLEKSSELDTIMSSRALTRAPGRDQGARVGHPRSFRPEWIRSWPLWLQGAAALLLAWQDRAFERAALAALDERQLKDVGLTRVDIVTELAEPLWSRRRRR